MPHSIRRWNRSDIFFHVLLVVLVVQLGSACDRTDREQSHPPHPNVLLVAVDALRADHLKSYGYEHETSPSLDRLAQEGARFETGLAPSSWGLPSLVTLLTALPPEQHRVNRADLALRDDALTLAEVLKDAGFATAAIAAGPGSEPSRGLSQGFDRYTHVPSNAPTGIEAVSWLTDWDRKGRALPFFLFVKIPLEASDHAPTPTPERALDLGDLDASSIERTIERYDRRIRLADAQLNLILQKLDQLELTSETLVIATASHGEEFLERGNIGHGNTLHRESVQVPLIVRFPNRVKQGMVIAQPGRLMDIGSTIMMLTRVREPEAFGFHHKFHGLAMRDLTEFLVGEWNGQEILIGGDLSGKSRSVRLGRYKLIQRGNDHIALYDLALDPDEQLDIAGTEIRHTAVLRKKLESWRRICEERNQYAMPHLPVGP
jgi:arylsulfatase A-like enzyme